jgi:selenobiotic family peptide radical SAM maturase
MGLAILDDLQVFCRNRQVKGQVSFSGGNPLLYPHFTELYRAAKERGMGTAILGNPAPRERMEELLEIQRPNFFQVSLEGLPAHNDAVRGPGNFEKIVKFLEVLRELGIYSMVMLTLTRDNLDQVLPLAEFLRERTDSFTFNRLSPVGEGANLQLPSPDAYRAFLESYVKAVETNPVLALKDNLINILYHQKGGDPFGGCTGFGCGAAFNFLTVLPDGEVHACRKFPSLIGMASELSLEEVYESEPAKRYRAGTNACRACPIRPVCGGCLAVVYGHGLDVFKARDPYCFMESSSRE